MNNTKDTNDTVVLVENPIDKELVIAPEEESLQIGAEIELEEFLSLIEIEADITILNFISFYTQDRVSKRELESIKDNIKKKKAIETNDYIITCTDSEIRIYPPKFYYSARLRVNDEFMGLKFIKSDSKDALVLPCDDFIIRVNEEGDEIETVKSGINKEYLVIGLSILLILIFIYVIIRGHKKKKR